MLSWSPNKENDTATTKVDYHYYKSLKTKTYYQHYDGADNAKAAAEQFLIRHPNAISHNLKHEQDRQCFILCIVEKYNAS